MRRTVDIDLADLLRTAAAPVDGDEISVRILDAASELFLTHGIRRCSVEDIAEHSGLGRTTIYRRFDGRGQIIEAVIARECHRFFTSILESTSHLDRFQDVVVEGFLTGLRAVETSILSNLVRDEPDLLRVLTVDAGPVLTAARSFLVAAFGPVASAEDRAQVASVSELLVRLAISMVLSEQTVLPIDGPHASAEMHRLLDPLLDPLAELRRG